MLRNSKALFFYAESLGISKEDAKDAMRAAGLRGDFDEGKWCEYIACLDSLATQRRVASMVEKYSVDIKPSEPLSQMATRALKQMSKRKWLFPPIRKTKDGYKPDPKGELEGELVYEGVTND